MKSLRTGMFLGLLALLLVPGCTPRYVLRMSNPEQATTVTLFEGGSDDTEDDDRTTVVDEPQRIARIAAFFKDKADEFYKMDAETPRMPRCTVVFRQDMNEADRFWLDPTHLYMRTPEGDYFACKITQRESSDLIGIFRLNNNTFFAE